MNQDVYLEKYESWKYGLFERNPVFDTLWSIFGYRYLNFTRCGDGDKVQFDCEGTRSIESSGVVKRRGVQI